jgi:hypothetical protein
VNSSSPYGDVIPLTAQPVQVAMAAFVAAIRNDKWFSFSTCKMLVAIACSANHRSLAEEFITY